MSFEEKNRDGEDAQVESALRHFRESVHDWSDREFTRPRAVVSPQRGGLWLMRHRAIGWGMAAVLAVSAIAVPVQVHQLHEQQKIAREKAEADARLKQQEAERQQALAMNDEELMRHVDSDIAQVTPDAMEPLASLMDDTN